MSLTTTLAHQRIEEYHRLRDFVGLSRHAELSHTIAMRAMDLLRRARFGIGEKWMEMLRDWCHFPHLKNEVSVWNFSLGGIKIQYPVGIAAGMFKDVARVPWELFGEGGMQVGFVTIGGITRYAQPGNPRPRHFSFPNKIWLGWDGINRYGLNNAGVESARDSLRLARKQWRIPEWLPIVANICNGASTLDKDKPWELRQITRTIIDEVDAIEVNISCPNQKDAKELGEKRELLRESLRLVHEEANGKPIFLKISPDTNDEMLQMIIEVSREFVTGYSSTNTTTDPEIRKEVLEKVEYDVVLRQTPDEKRNHGDFTLKNGGISGSALLPRQLYTTARIRELAPEKYIIGIGGIGDEISAGKTIIAGAQAMALYSRLAQDGPGVIPLVNIGAAQTIEALARASAHA